MCSAVLPFALLSILDSSTLVAYFVARFHSFLSLCLPDNGKRLLVTNFCLKKIRFAYLKKKKLWKNPLSPSVFNRSWNVPYHWIQIYKRRQTAHFFFIIKIKTTWTYYYTYSWGTSLTKNVAFKTLIASKANRNTSLFGAIRTPSSKADRFRLPPKKTETNPMAPIAFLTTRSLSIRQSYIHDHILKLTGKVTDFYFF